MAKMLVTIIATLLLLIPIVVLYYIHKTSLRLLAIAMFTIAFSASLALLTRAKASDIFTATAA